MGIFIFVIIGAPFCLCAFWLIQSLANIAQVRSRHQNMQISELNSKRNPEHRDRILNMLVDCCEKQVPGWREKYEGLMQQERISMLEVMTKSKKRD